MGTLVVGIVLVILTYFVSTLWFLNRNYRAARAVGVPIVICPYDPENVSLLHFAPDIFKRNQDNTNSEFSED